MITAKYIYKKVKHLNIPLWGTCQGLEVISVLEGGSDILKPVLHEGA